MNDPYTIISKLLDASPLLPGNAKRLLAHLEDHRNKATGQCNPRYETLAKELGVCLDTVYENIRKLKTVGLIQVVKGQRGNSFQVAPKAQWAAILRRVKPEAETIPASGFTRGERRVKPEAETAYPYMNLSLRNLTREETPKEEKTQATSAGEGLTPPAPPGDLFPLFWACFVNAGVALNSRDEQRARRMFSRYPPAEQDLIGKWVLEQMQTVWTSEEYTPGPVSALRSKGWLRRAGPRIVPRPMTKAERSDAAVHAYFVWRDGGKVGNMPL